MKILVIRFSAMGDVALTVPALKRVIKANPGLEITFLSQSHFEPFFLEIPRFSYWGIDLKGWKGWRGIEALYRLSQGVKEPDTFSAIIDLHGSLRSRMLSLLLNIKGIPCFKIDKGKKEKNKAIRKEKKVLIPLKSAINRYMDVFKNAGLSLGKGYFQDQDYNFRLDESWEGISRQSPSSQVLLLGNMESFLWKGEPPSSPFRIREEGKAWTWIGWAPFAGLPLKEMNMEQQVKQVYFLLDQIPQLKILLMASPVQKPFLDPFWINDSYKERIYFSGNLAKNLSEELSMIQELDLMVSMDSANMHIASLLGVKVLGIYGTTHPDLGFFPYLQRQSGTFGLENLSCRPCTVFGKGKCYRGDFACMNQITIQDLSQRILSRLF